MLLKRTFISALLTALLALAAWAYHDPSTLSELARRAGSIAQPVLPKVGTSSGSLGQAAGELRKCRTAAGELVYTNVECPSGSRLQAINAGSVTVVPFERPAPAPASGSVKSPLRALAGPPISEEQREKQMEKIINP